MALPRREWRDDRVSEPVDLRSGPDDDLVALHALRPPTFDGLTDAERAGWSPGSASAGAADVDDRADSSSASPATSAASAGGWPRLLRRTLVDDGR